jgi:transcriptional regulator with XRE-family HTH domain
MIFQVGEALKQLRIEKGYENLSDFVKEFELPMIHYWRIESGKTNMTLKSLMRVLEIHDIPITEFFCSLKR